MAGANSAEGRAPWSVGLTGAAMDQTEGGAELPALVYSWKVTGAFPLPKEGPPACSDGGPDSEDGVWGLPGIRKLQWPDLGSP